MENLELVPTAEVLQLQYETSKIYGASGSVYSWSDENDDQEDESDVNDDTDAASDALQHEDQRVKLSKILEINIHDFSEQKLDRLEAFFFQILISDEILVHSVIFIYVRNTLGIFWTCLQKPTLATSRGFGSNIESFI